MVITNLFCPKNNSKLCIKTKPIDECKEMPEIYRCIRSSRDRLGFLCRDAVFWDSVICKLKLFFCDGFKGQLTGKSVLRNKILHYKVHSDFQINFF